MKIGLQIGMSTTLLLAAVSTASAATRSVCPVGCPYSTIQGAVDAAGNGDVIQIGKGRYVENVVIVEKRVTLQGADRRTTIIDGNGQGPVVTIGDPGTGSRAAAGISGLTLTRGYSPNGGGIALFFGGALTLRDSTVVANHSTGNGGGISLNSLEPVTIADSTTTNNDAQFIGGGIFATGESTNVSITRTTIAANRANTVGGGIALDFDGGNLSLTDTDVVDNSAQSAGGVEFGAGIPQSTLTVQNVTVTGNKASKDSGGLSLSGVATLNHVVVAHNVAGTTGGGLSTMSGGFRLAGTTTLNDVYVVQNTATGGGGGIENFAGLIVGSNVVIANNSPDNCAQSSGQSGCP
jgi:hypothetical protein